MNDTPSAPYGHVSESVYDNIADLKERERATDPTRSCIVQAPAGSGKTTLLVTRYLRLLSMVRQPEEILAITFTRKAAKEMRQRVLETLHKDLAPEAQAANRVIEERKWNVLESPQRLRIQTIDSFVFSLVKRLPYESQLSLDYEQLQDARPLYAEAVEDALDDIYRNDSLARMLSKSMAVLNNNHGQIVRLVADMLDKREQWMPVARALVSASTVQHDIGQVDSVLEQGRQIFIDGLIDRFRSNLTAQTLADIEALMLGTSSTQGDQSPVEPNSNGFWKYASIAFTTKAGSYRKRHNLKALGLDAKDQGRVEYWTAICEKLKAEDPNCYLHTLQDIPTDPLDEVVAEAIQSFAVLLIIASDKLTSLFVSRKVVDFTEMAIAASRALKSDNMPSEIALALDYRISHILVDEFQDTSRAQSELLNQLMEGWQENDGNSFFAVGDPMQSIYRFRNADLTNFMSAFSSGLPNRALDPIRLVTNFRSAPSLVSWANDLFEEIFGVDEDSNTEQVAFTKSIAAKLDEGAHHLTICESKTLDHEAEAIAERIQYLKDTFPDEGIALLTRARTKLDTYFDVFKRHDITWRGVEIIQLKDVEVVRDLHMLARTVVNSRDKLAWLSVLRSPLVGLELVELEKLTELECFKDVLEFHHEDWNERARVTVNRIATAFTEAYESLHRPLRSRVERLWYQLGGNDAHASDESPNDHLIQANRFFEVMEEYPPDTIDLDEMWHRIESMYASESLEDADIEVMTIHKAKGLEFGHVLIPNLNGDSRPGQKPLLHIETIDGNLLISAKLPSEADEIHDLTHDVEKQRDLNELKRLFYVAVTRAQKSVSLFATLPPETETGKTDTFLRLMPQRMYQESDTVERRASNVEDLDDSVDTQNYWTRLVSEYGFEKPTSLPSFDPSSLLPTEEFDDQLDAIGKIPQTTIGTFVHRELHRMVKDRDLQEPSAERVSLWRNEIRAMGHTDIDVNQILEISQRQIGQILLDTKGRWVLDPDHAESGTEIEFNTTENGVFEKVILDRSFVDEDGVRWIIDYKTTTLGEPSPGEIESLKLRHRGQLVRYAEILSNVEDRPIKLALYLTDISEFVPIEYEESTTVPF